MSSPGNEKAERYPNSGTDDANTITSTSEKQSHTYRIDIYQPVSWLPSTSTSFAAVTIFVMNVNNPSTMISTMLAEQPVPFQAGMNPNFDFEEEKVDWCKWRNFNQFIARRLFLIYGGQKWISRADICVYYIILISAKKVSAENVNDEERKRWQGSKRRRRRRRERERERETEKRRQGKRRLSEGVCSISSRSRHIYTAK